LIAEFLQDVVSTNRSPTTPTSRVEIHEDLARDRQKIGLSAVTALGAAHFMWGIHGR
jgi:hypothetical protein